jgi:hypothetical protein
VNGGAGELTACIDGALVGVQSGKGRQQRRMNIDQTVLVLRHKA